jgi:hypothetical protein
MAESGEKMEKNPFFYFLLFFSRPKCTGAGFFLSNAARQIMPRRLQIPFYKRAGFLGLSAHVCGGPVKPRSVESIS